MADLTRRAFNLGVLALLATRSLKAKKRPGTYTDTYTDSY